MKNISKIQLGKVVCAMSNKTQSWNQVAKQLSGLKGSVAISDKESVNIHEAWAALGVDAQGSRISPKSLKAAWSEQLMRDAMPSCENVEQKKRNNALVPQIVKADGVYVKIGGKRLRLYVRNEKNKLEPYKVLRRFDVVSATDKLSNAECQKQGIRQIVVSAQTILRGLYQSAFVADTLRSLADSESDYNVLTLGIVNMGTKEEPVWINVKHIGGEWSLATEEDVVEINAIIENA